MSDEEVLKKLKSGELLLIDKSSLAMMYSALRRDKENGSTVRGEILTEVVTKVNELNIGF